MGNRLKPFLVAQFSLLIIIAYWNGIVGGKTKFVAFEASDVSNTEAFGAPRIDSFGTRHQSVSFAADRTDTIAQVNYCTHLMDLPPSYGPLELMLNEDDILRGKSCTTTTTNKNNNDTITYLCRDCGLACQYPNWTACPEISRRTPRCKHNYLRDWNAMSKTVMDTRAPYQPSRRAITQYYEGMHLPPRDLIQIDCRGVTDQRCFNLSRCNQDILTVYPYNGTKVEEYLKRMHDHNPNLIQIVDNPHEACLVVLSCDYLHKESFRLYHELFYHEHWQEGRNHFIWQANRCIFDAMDYILVKRANFQRAALSTPNLIDMNIRHGYDMSIPYFQREKEQEFQINASQIHTMEDIHRRRRYFLSFKGYFQLQRNLPWQNHRWLAKQYWDEAHDVLIDVRCGKMGSYETDTGSYGDTLLASTFVFCPGGISPGSYRFHEALALQAIPVVTTDFVAPLEGDVDWTHCLVRVSESRIADLPRLLREKYPDERDIRKRREVCQKLFQSTIGWVKNDTSWRIDHGETTFHMAIKAWAARVAGAFAQRAISHDILGGVNS